MLEGSPLSSTCYAGAAIAPLPQVTLRGVVRDFRPEHPDFGLVDSSQFGHYSGNVAPLIGVSGRPLFTNEGRNVFEQFRDRDGNNIKPYGDRGLVGGHFDVDIFDAPTTRKLYHKHQYDDSFDTTTIDIANTAILLFRDVCAGYPNPLRAVVINPHNSGMGQFVFEAGGPIQSGLIADGITGTFFADDVTQFRVSFQTLNTMRGTEPKVAQGDIVDRDDSFGIRLFDVVTDELVYEIDAYHHVRHGNDGDGGGGWAYDTPPNRTGTDNCGNPIADISGTYAAPGTGAVTSQSSFDQWFRYVPGENLEVPHDIVMTRGNDGVYSYSSNSFFPIDDEDLYGRQDDGHNHFFTFNIEATATYVACQGLFIEAAATDDVWVFVNGELVIDSGGAASPQGQRVSLDRLNLVDGEDFNIAIYYAQRREIPESTFSLSTNIQFEASHLMVPTMVGFD